MADAGPPPTLTLARKLVVPVVVAGAAAASVPFVVAGAPVAIAAGVAGLASGLSGAIMARRLARRALVLAGVVVIAIGGTHIGRAVLDRREPEHASSECATPAACEELARSLEGVQPARAADAFRRACELGGAEACVTAGEYWNHLGKLDTQDPAQANVLFERGCAAGHTLACVLLGINLLEGRGGPRDGARGERLLTAACDGGNGRGCRAVGIGYRDGDGVPRDSPKAIAMFELGCKAGDEKACGHAGTEILRNAAAGDKQRGLVLLERACAAEPSFCYNLGLALDQGIAGRKDPVRAREVYERACTAEHASACNNLAIMWRDGEGGAADKSRARELWDRACRLHLERGCANLRRFGL